MRNPKRLTIIPLIIAALLTFSAGECKKANTDPTKPKPTLVERLNLIEVNANIISGQIQVGLGFVKQLAQNPKLKAINGFSDEIALAESTLLELQKAGKPFFDAAREFATTKDAAGLRAAFEKLKPAVDAVRPHVDAIVAIIVNYINTNGGNADLADIQTGIAVARLVFDGALVAIPAFIK